MEGWKNKIFSLLKGPGWTPGSPWTGFIDEVPDVRVSQSTYSTFFKLLCLHMLLQVKGRKKHSYPRAPVWRNVYLLIHFFIVLFAYEFVSIFREVSNTKLNLFHVQVQHFKIFGINLANVNLGHFNSPDVRHLYYNINWNDV